MIGAKPKIALPHDAWNGDPGAARAKEDAIPAPKPRKKVKKVKKEKTDREEIFEALQKLGHEPSYFEVAGRPQSLHGLSCCDADLISFPLIVKPSWEDGSIGIDAGSVVKNVKEMMERVEYIQDEFDSPALIEEYIEGREIYAGILGNYERAQVLPLIELDLSRLPEGMPKIASYDVKFEKNSEAYKLTKSGIAEDLDDETRKRLSDTALAAYRALKLRDYGRIDMRLAPNGDVYVIEANPNPWLASRQEFAMAAKASGLSYPEMIGTILDLAMSRYLNADFTNAAAMH